MNLHKVGLLVSVVGAFLGFVSAAHAHVWSGSIVDYTGIDYALSDLTEDRSARNSHSFLLDASGYNQHADPSLPETANVKVWDGRITAFALLGRPVGSVGTLPNGSINNGGYSGCGNGNGGLACAEASTKDLFNADSDPHSLTIQATAARAASSSSSAAVTHVGAVHENRLGAREIYGITSVIKPIPEPRIYAMMLAGLGLMGFVVNRRRQESGGAG